MEWLDSENYTNKLGRWGSFGSWSEIGGAEKRVGKLFFFKIKKLLTNGMGEKDVGLRA